MPPNFYTDNAWSTWNLRYTLTTSASSTNDQIWLLWSDTTNCTATTLVSSNDLWGIWHADYQESKEQKAARLVADQQRVEAARLRQIEARARTEEARTKAEILLLGNLTAEQRAEYEEHKHFHVRARSGKRYRIQCGRAHNVFTVRKDGLAVIEHCAHVGAAVPNEDNILAQKLLIEHDEEAFLRTANSRNLRNLVLEGR